MHLPKSSSSINEEYACIYSNPEKFNKSSFWGWKLVIDKVENYYSVGTGAYRYQTGKVVRRNADWSVCYKDTKYYHEIMVDKIGVFTSMEDLQKFFPEYNSEGLVVLKVKLSGDLHLINAENKYHTCKVIIGTHIEKMERYE